MKKDKQKSAYSMRQELLYTICFAAWKLCSKFIDNFASLKAFYTQAFAAAQIKTVASAKRLPGVRQSNNASTDARIDLVMASKLVLVNFQMLKGYIEVAFIPEKVEAMLEAAGNSLYPKAAGGSWDNTRSLIAAATTFIENNVDTLTDKNNMPPAFQGTFEAVGDACIAAATKFAELETDKEKATNDKIEANNMIYASLTRLAKDALIVFKKDPAIQKQFTITNLVAANKGEGAASLSGYVRDENKLPVANAVVSSVEGIYSATTDEKGKYTISRISAADEYTFSVVANGYQQVSQTIAFKPGTARRANFMLTVVSNVPVAVPVSVS